MPLSKNKIQLIERLKTRKGRAREGLVLVEGVRCVEEALAAGVDVRFAVRSPRLSEQGNGEALAASLAERDVPVETVEDQDMSWMTATEQPQGILVVCREPKTDLASLGAASCSPILLLDAIQDPGNLGTLVRAARAFGVSTVVALDGSVDPWNAKAVRASAGAAFHVDVVRAKWAEVEPWLESGQVRVLAADPSGGDVSEADHDAPWALAVGNEGAGLRPELLAATAYKVAIPMGRGADSLNAGVAGSILLYVLTANGSVVP